MRKIILKFIFFFFLLIINFNSFSQQTEASIGPVTFNSSLVYGPGSGITVHIDPQGVFELIDAIGNDGEILANDLESNLNNQFILELSESDGSFENPTELSTVNDFYTPLINGVIPDNISPGSDHLCFVYVFKCF